MNIKSRNPEDAAIAARVARLGPSLPRKPSTLTRWHRPIALAVTLTFPLWVLPVIFGGMLVLIAFLAYHGVCDLYSTVLNALEENWS